MTARPFTYEVSKNILQYLPLEKRTEIAVFCPDVKRAERKADMYLHYLRLDRQSLRINDVIYSWNSSKLPDEPEKCSVKIWRGYLYSFSRNLDISVEEIMKKLFDFWLGNRGVVKVNVLEIINGYQGVCLPKNLKMECKELNLSENVFSPVKSEGHELRTLQFIRQFLTDTSLEKLSIFAYDAPDPTFQHDLVRTARNLEIFKKTYEDKSIVSELVQLTNQQIHVKGANENFAKEDVVTLARSWLQKCPKIGTRFTLELRCACLGFVTEVLELVSPITEMISGDELHIYKEDKYLVMEVRQSLHRSFAKFNCKD